MHAHNSKTQQHPNLYGQRITKAHLWGSQWQQRAVLQKHQGVHRRIWLNSLSRLEAWELLAGAITPQVPTSADEEGISLDESLGHGDDLKIAEALTALSKRIQRHHSESTSRDWYPPFKCMNSRNIHESSADFVGFWRRRDGCPSH